MTETVGIWGIVDKAGKSLGIAIKGTMKSSKRVSKFSFWAMTVARFFEACAEARGKVLSE